MKLLNIKQLYKIIKSGNSSDLKEYSKSMSPSEVDGLRVNNHFVFKIIRWIINYKFRNVKHNLGAAMPYDSSVTSKVTAYTDSQLDYVKSILDTIPQWDILSNIDGDKTDAKYITLDYNMRKGEYDGFEDSLQWTCYLAAGIARTLHTTQDQALVRPLSDLLDGISKCLITDGKYAIVRHPSKVIEKDLEPISQDMISGVSLVITTLAYYNTHNVKIAEKITDIKNKYKAIMHHHDYHLMFADGTTDSYDLHPNYIYNHIRCFAYTSIRLIDGKFNKTDARILKEMLQMRLPEDKPPYERSWYGTVVAVNLLEAILYGYSRLSKSHKKHVSGVMDELDFAHLGLDLLKFWRDSTPEVHPELESVLHVFYTKLGHKDGKKETTKRALPIINTLYDHNVLRKSFSTYVPYQPAGKRPYPPVSRMNQDYNWQRSAWHGGYDEEQHPVFEYVTAYSRFLPFIYYDNKGL